MTLSLCSGAQRPNVLDSLRGVWADTTMAFDQRLDILASIYAHDPTFTEDQAAGRMPKRKLLPEDYIRRRALFLPETARYDWILPGTPSP